MRWASDMCEGIPGGENTEAEVRGMFGMVESPFPMWEHVGAEWRRGGSMQEEKQGEGGGAQILEGLERHAKGWPVMDLVSIFHLSQKIWTIFRKPREGSERYRAHLFRFYVCAYVYIFLKAFTF